VPPRDWRVRLADILESIARIRKYVAGMTFQEFCPWFLGAPV
jgi:uncharacterized protein with HEPN domain